ncbi:dipeptidyl-peptidase 3 [Penicillium herquei]|nr:dipeptidyl-peptidase 3 [Penicillium herquei]
MTRSNRIYFHLYLALILALVSLIKNVGPPNGEITHRLEIGKVFDRLAEDEDRDGKSHRVYAHHLARACWHGSRITLRQTSSEAEGIFDFILLTHQACAGEWGNFIGYGLTKEEVDSWLEFAGMFMSSLRNYFGDGNHKVIPDISVSALRKMASISAEASAKLEEIIEPMMSAQPVKLGHPVETSQSGYYPRVEKITKEEIEALSGVITANGIKPNNTRLLKHTDDPGQTWFEVLLASSEMDSELHSYGWIQLPDQPLAKVYLRRGDHSKEIKNICLELAEAQKHATTSNQEAEMHHLINNFRTVGIADAEETEKLGQIVARSTEFLCSLPWAVPENDGKGLFEYAKLEAPDFSIIHSLASVSFTVWEAFNLNLNLGDGMNYGVKNILYSNRMALNSSPGRPCYYVHPSEADLYMKYAHIARFITTSIHELLGHGTGKLLRETAPGEFNFDRQNPPISPVTGQPIQNWYKLNETWGTVFGKLASTVEECRAFLFADYFIDNKDILALFGYGDYTFLTADDLIYYVYLHIGVEGLRALRSYKAEDQAWGGDHDQALFAIFNHMLNHSNGVITVDRDVVDKKLYIHVDREKITSYGKLAIGQMLCKLHIWHSTADIEACKPYYEALSTVDDVYESWRQIVVSNPEPKWKFVQPNTFLKDDGTVELREYEASNAGIIKSFYGRNI